MNAMPDAEETGSGRERSNGICLYPATCHQYHERDEQDDTPWDIGNPLEDLIQSHFQNFSLPSMAR
jgi:hypothetical protein